MQAYLKFAHAAAFAALCAVPAAAQDCAAALEMVRPVTVRLKATAQAASGPQMSQTVDSHASGVLVSEDGHVLTVNHLLTKLGDFVPQTLTISAEIADTRDSQRAWVLDSEPNTDLLLLKLRLPGPYPHGELGSAFGLEVSTDIATYGFPATGSLDASDVGLITSQTPDGGSLWATDLSFAEGQSGSPVVDCEGAIIAVAKGKSRTSGAGMIIPIDLADPLLVSLRLVPLRSEMDAIIADRVAALSSDLSPLRRQFDWSADKADGGVVISYKRRVLGGPDVAHVDATLSASGRDPSGRPYRLPDLTAQLSEVARSAAGGEFEWAVDLQDLEETARAFSLTEIRYQLELKPVILEQGDEKFLETVVVDVGSSRE